MNKKSNRIKYYLQYSGLFLILFLLIYSVFFIEGKSFVYSLYGDGHICFNSLVYYGEWLRTILRTGHIPSFDLTVGYGSDLFLTLSWETLGDPLNLLAVFFDADHMEYLYDFLAVFRIYLAGIAFSIFARCHYCKSRGEGKSNLTILAGSLIYVFSGFVLFAGVRDVYFMTPVIFFPLMASGIDRILQERKPVMLIVATALAAISNYYYFYMLTVFTVLYALLAYAAEQELLRCRGKRNGRETETAQDGTEGRSNLRKNSRRFLQAFLSCAGAYLIGTLIACVQLVPIAIYLMESSRSQQQYYVPLLYSLEFYARAFSGYISSASNTAWTHLGFAPIMLPAVAVLFLNRKKTYRPYRIAFAACVLFLCIPRIGSILNGMTYPVNRWIWAFSMLNACVFILVEDDLFHLNRRGLIFVLAACSLYSAVCLSVPQLRTRQEKWMILILLLTAAVILLVNTRGKRAPSPARSDLSAGSGREINRENPAGKKAAAYLTGYQCVGLVLVIIGVTANGLFRFAPFGSNYAAGFVDAGQAWPLVNDSLATDLVQDREDLAAVRVDAIGDTLPMCNTGMNHGINGTDFYFSLANGSVTQFMDDLGVNVEMEHRYAGLDGRTILERLFGVEYVVTNENNAAFVPYGYQEETAGEETSGDGKDTCYTDSDTLPLGYGYDSIIRESDFAELDAVKKQEAILQSAVVSDEDYETLSGSLQEGDPVYNDQETSFAVVSTADGIAIHDSEITVSEENAQITLRVQAVQDAETYLVLASPEYDLGSPEEQGMALIDFSVDDSTKQMKLYSVTHPYNHGRKEYIINLGYNDSDTVRTVTVTFHNTGIYRASSIRAVCQPMTLVGDQTAARRETVLQDISLGDDSITGTVDAKKDTLLCISVPYSSGWTATIDGKKAEVVRTQDMFLGVAVPAGEHEIRLLYETPGQKEGMALSISGLLLLAGIFVCQHRRKKRTLQKKQEIKAVWGDHEQDETAG